ncbi:hypothetical protein HYR65_03445 [Candidatus Azambacteria bacterium]|nr:hypothetical protein [Candidatus Azambacteria bacterium]
MTTNIKIEDLPKYVAVLLAVLPVRQKDVLHKRFGLKDGRRRTLEEIGDEYGITRERVRQIENDAKETLAESERMEKLGGFYEILKAHFQEHGGLRAEHKLFDEDLKKFFTSALKKEIARAYLHFLLALHESFTRHPETDEFHTAWSLAHVDPSSVKKSLGDLVRKLDEHREPISREELFKWFAELTGEQQAHVLESYLVMSKQIGANVFGEYGLSDWPEISMRGVRDKAYLVLKKHEKPLHFRDIVERINDVFKEDKEAHPQTVHNELIKNEKFVLVGRGTYALSEWGYKPGKVADVLERVFKDQAKPLSKEEVIAAVLKERSVKPNTISLNLQNRARFERMKDGRFVLKA